MNQYLTFSLDDHLYGVPVSYINSVLDPQAITPLPHVNSIITGLTNVRGNVVPMFNPREALKMTKIEDKIHSSEAAALDDGTEKGIIIFEIENGTLLPFIGIQVDKIGKVMNLPEEELAPVPDFLPDAAKRLFEGFYILGNTRLNIINLRLISSRETLFNYEGASRA